MIIALGIVAGLVIGVAWLLHRIALEISRFDEWDSPPIRSKREHWR